MKPDIRCPVCLSEFNQHEIRSEGETICPTCHTSLAPIYIQHDGYIRVNWQDLRMLAIFAKRWAAHFDPLKRGNRDTLVALDNICKSLERFQPRGAQSLLGAQLDEMMKPKREPAPLISIEIQTNPTKLPDGSVLSPWQIKK